MRDLEKERHEALTEDVTVLLDMHVKGHLDENTPEQVILVSGNNNDYCSFQYNYVCAHFFVLYGSRKMYQHTNLTWMD